MGYSWSKYNYATFKYEEISTSQNLVISEGGSYVLTVDEGNCEYSTSVFASSTNCVNGADAVNHYLTSNAARPGFTNYCYGNIQNLGDQPLSNCTYEITFDDSKITFESTPYNTPGITINNNKAAISLANIAPGEYLQIKAAFLVSSDVQLLGETLFYTSNISCTSQENNINNNSYSFSRIIGGAYDPNFVLSNYGDGEIADTTSFIKYDVGFQNTGSDTAFTVVVKNKIDTSVFDLSTIKMLGATHKYIMGINPDGTVTWTFNNIYLPDSTVDEHGSHGQLQITIQLKDGLVAGTELKDSANIYFDFNPPVTTNTAFNKLIEQGSSVAEKNGKAINLMVYPNPSNDMANISVTTNGLNSQLTISVVDMTGKIILAPITLNHIDQSTNIPFSTEMLSNGMYLVKVSGENLNQSIQLIVMH